METVLSSKKPSAELKKLRIEVDPLFEKMIDAALVEGGNANLEDFIGNIDFKDVDQLLDGISSF